jgi:hypothetical protein
VSLLSSASSIERASAFGAIEGAPKSVVASPSRRSTTRIADASSGASNPSLVPRRTLAYRGAESSSASRAAGSSRPERHQPGHSTAPAKARFAPISRYVGIFAGPIATA